MHNISLFKGVYLLMNDRRYLIPFHCIFFALVQYLFVPDLSISVDMMENFAWGQIFNLGTYRHPPLTGWETGIWFRFFPRTYFFYIILSYFNVFLALIGILKIAKLYNINSDKILWVVVFALLAYSYGSGAAKFNANTVLLPWWTWSVYFFLLNIEKISNKPYLASFLLGATSAFMVLGKYFSIILLLSFFIISIRNKKNREWFYSPCPYIAISTFIFFLLPHFVWLLRAKSYCFKYAISKFGESVININFCKFILSPFCFNLFSWVVFFYFLFFNFSKLKNKNLLTNRNINLFLVIAIPFILTIIIGIIAKVDLKSDFSLPIWCGLPLIMTIILSPIINFPNTLILKKYAFFYYFFVVFCYLSFLIISNINIKQGHDKYFIARKEMTLAVEEFWLKEYKNKPVFKWVAGDWYKSSTMAFFSDKAPIVYLDFPNKYKMINISRLNWKNSNGLLLCGHLMECSVIEKWLVKQNKPIIKKNIIYFSNDLRLFYKPLSRTVTVYFYIV